MLQAARSLVRYAIFRVTVNLTNMKMYSISSRKMSEICYRTNKRIAIIKSYRTHIYAIELNQFVKKNVISKDTVHEFVMCC